MHRTDWIRSIFLLYFSLYMIECDRYICLNDALFLLRQMFPFSFMLTSDIKLHVIKIVTRFHQIVYFKNLNTHISIYEFVFQYFVTVLNFTNQDNLNQILKWLNPIYWIKIIKVNWINNLINIIFWFYYFKCFNVFNLLNE